MIGLLDHAVATYALAISLTAGLGAFALSADLFARLLARRSVRILNIYAGVLGLAVLLGVPVFGLVRIVGAPTSLALVGSLPVGLALGWSTRRADRWIVRYAARRTGRQRAPAPQSRRSGGFSRPSRIAPANSKLLLGGQSRRASDHRARGAPEADPREFPLSTVVVVGAAEEMFYRGVLLQAALLAGSWRAGLLVCATVVAFALTHVSFGWSHVAAKTPLAIGAVGSALVMGSILPAIVAHIWFNASAWKDMQAADRFWR